MSWPPDGSFEHNQKTSTTPATGVQLQAQPVPGGFAVLVKALPTNTNPVFIGKTKAAVESATTRFPLKASEFVTLQVKDVSKIWLDVTTSGEGVAWIVEAKD